MSINIRMPLLPSRCSLPKMAVLISAALFETLVRGRVARRMKDLDDETLKAIAAAEVPAHFAYLENLDLG